MLVIPTLPNSWNLLRNTNELRLDEWEAIAFYCVEEGPSEMLQDVTLSFLEFSLRTCLLAAGGKIWPGCPYLEKSVPWTAPFIKGITVEHFQLEMPSSCYWIHFASFSSDTEYCFALLLSRLEIASLCCIYALKNHQVRQSHGMVVCFMLDHLLLPWY